MTAIIWADLQPLLDQFKGDGLMVSCYADLTIERGFQSRWAGPFKAKADTIKKTLGDDQRAWHACMQDLHAIESVLRSSEARQAHGMAILSAKKRGFFRALPLDVPVENELVIHEAPYLVPLLEALHRQRDYLVVHTNTHRGRLYAAHPGAVRLLQEIEGDVPKRQHSAGECWGTQQATIARHREDRILHYQKELVRITEATWTKLPFQGLVLLGEHEVLEHVRTRLPQRLAGQVIFGGPLAWTAKPLSDHETIGTVLADALKAQEKRILEEVKDRLHQGYGIAAGPGEVVEALQNGRVGARGYGYLVLGPDPRETVARCIACRFLSAEMPASCPRCQSPCVDANLWEELLLLTLRHDIAVHFVKPDAELQGRGGVFAVLPKTRDNVKVTD
jgi:peptide subunit release factor 1 (eRF1)